MQSNKATITKADKGNTVVIIYQKDYCRKIKDFIENNNLVTANNDPTKTFQKKVRNAMNECQIVVDKEERWKYINMNPAAPTIRGMIKIHKADAPIRTVINWRNAPAYKLAKMLKKISDIHTSTIYLQCKKFHTSNRRPPRYSIQPKPSICVVRHYQHVFQRSELLHIIDICDQQVIEGKVKKNLKNWQKL